MRASALIRHADTGRWLEFTRPVGVLTTAAPQQAAEVIAAAEQAARQRGLHAVGFVTYEAAPGFEPKHVTHPPGRLPPVWFALFAEARTVPAPAPAAAPMTAPDWRPTVDGAAYRGQVAAIRRYIGAGDSYQVNLSYRLRAPLHGGADAASQLFQAMVGRQPGGYGAFLETSSWALCCASHELFFSRRGRRLVSRPMKGTAPRGASPTEDAGHARWLTESLKNRAENLMITDMVRNDLGRLADIGSVRTERLFQLEPYPTLWQLTSTVTADSDASLADIFRALFPAASITGAPKRRTMEIIRELEQHPREIYTGAVGVIEPGGDAQFNVAIRTAWVDKQLGRAEYGVGGGILWDSEADDEYQETRTKSRILAPLPAPQGDDFALLETLLWEPGSGYLLLSEHLQRLQRAADQFQRPLPIAAVRDHLALLARNLGGGPQRVRLLVGADGAVSSSTDPLDLQARPALVALARSPSPVLNNPFVAHKTTRRALYEQARREAAACSPGSQDVLLRNERGEVTESTIANVVVDLGGVLVTPPLCSGLLPGLYRQHLLNSNRLTEQVLYPQDLAAARGVYLVNSLRGMWPVTLLD
ncbi:MAG: chorismate-binding protein [Pseudomonadales bacterium]